MDASIKSKLSGQKSFTSEAAEGAAEPRVRYMPEWRNWQYAMVSNTIAARRVGSSPTLGTTKTHTAIYSLLKEYYKHIFLGI